MPPRRWRPKKRTWSECAGKLRRALDLLGDRLVAIYEAGSPDMLNAILESEDWSEMAAQTEYLRQIQDYDDAVVDRVKTLRDEVRGRSRTARRAPRGDRSRARCDRRQGGRSRAPRSQEAAASFRELKSEQAARQEALEALESREAVAEQQPLGDLRTDRLRRRRRDHRPDAGAAQPRPGSGADHHESEASAPASAPQAVKDAISAANAIATTPYIWGGGHGSFESSGYDCSGAVSYALHGGGMLESPLDSTGLSTWGEPGPGRWITVYANSGHAWMVIAGIAFDTSGGAGPRWHDPWVNSPEGFIARHPAGY